jgi:hypothetical protein
LIDKISNAVAETKRAGARNAWNNRLISFTALDHPQQIRRFGEEGLVPVGM